jgi:beta-phosphoglucomutase-like phosphatase (HAD superfamily)
LPPDQTSLSLARTLKRKHPNLFVAAHKSYYRGDAGPEETVAQAISEKRRDIFRFYIDAVSLRLPESRGAPLTLHISTDHQPRNSIDYERLKILRLVTVETCPYVREILGELEALSIPQGICTSSPRGLVVPILTKLGIIHKFRSGVFSDCVREGLHKPEPYPWRLLQSRLSEQNISETATTDRMLHFENSASGGISAILAGRGYTIIRADNISSIMGKLMKKVGEVGTHEIPGQAHFIPCFGKLLGTPI